jgi:hypothetical protein
MPSTERYAQLTATGDVGNCQSHDDSRPKRCSRIHARERLGQGLRAIQADSVAESDGISLRNH